MIDRLYALLPVYVRQRDDATEGKPLRSLLRIVEEQVDLVQDDIAGLYDNWFVETCDDWVLPYIGELVGYRPLRSSGAADLRPRADVANTVRTRRRKGTLAVLESLAVDVAGWPAIALEYANEIAATQSLRDVRVARGRTLDLRDAKALQSLAGEFGDAAHTIEIRRPGSSRTPGRFGIGSVGVVVSRLRAYSVSRSDARCRAEIAEHCYSFDALGHDTPLVSIADRLPQTIDIAAVTERVVDDAGAARSIASARYYGAEKSIAIWVRTREKRSRLELVARDRVVPADLGRWRVRVKPGDVAVDPTRGRLSFAPGHAPYAVVVRYHYGAAADLGAGEYARELQPFERVFRVAHDGREEHSHLREAVSAWQASGAPRAAIEFGDSHVYDERDLEIELAAEQHLEIRAADGARPIVRIEEDDIGRTDLLRLSGAANSRVTLDGLVLTGRGLEIAGELADVTIRRCTFTPHAAIVRVTSPTARLNVRHSVLGPIRVLADESQREPNVITVADSIVDATSHDAEAIGTPDAPTAFANISVERSTIFGHVRVHALDLAENSIFTDSMSVARRQNGCLRFCYVAPHSRTPDRYECQPDIALRGAGAATQDAERAVEPQFVGKKFGAPGYARLASTCPLEITTGAEDRSELGVFHDTYDAVRAANLLARLEAFVPANADVGIRYMGET